MPAETKKAEIKAQTPADRELAHLKAKEANLKRKIAERIPNFSEETRDKAMERAQRDLSLVQAKIKGSSKAP